MSAISELLRAEQRAGATLQQLEQRAATSLADGRFLGSQLADPDARLEESSNEFASLQESTRNAWSRWPAMSRPGFHGGEPEHRAMALYLTVGYLRDAGVYLPAEVLGKLQSGSVDARWAAAESVRICALVALLEALIDDLSTGRIQPADYPAQVQELARRIAALPLARPPDEGA